MYGDFSRDSYDPKNNFTRVLMQQGRLIVDADWNEQSAIVLNYLRTLAADIIGWHGGPGVTQKDGKPDSGAFVVTLPGNPPAVNVAGGRYYVDGIQIELLDEGYKGEDINRASGLQNRIVIVDVWEQHIAAVSNSSILDPALNGLDSSTRTRLGVRFKVLFTTIGDSSDMPTTEAKFRQLPIKKSSTDMSGAVLDSRPLRATKDLPLLTVWTTLDSSAEGDCVEEVDARYTGLENQLYRVEVHCGGKVFWNGERMTDGKLDPHGTPVEDSNPVTLKWSRDNGSVVYDAEMGSGSAKLKTKWRDETRAIRAGDWIELIKEPNENGDLVSVEEVLDTNGEITVTFKLPSQSDVKTSDPILVRRWDHRNRRDFPISKNGGILVKVNSDDTTTSMNIPLEDGIVVRLKLPPQGAEFRQGDYWLIPARAVTGDILWPKADGKSGPESYLPVPARYTEHHYAPIALIKPNAGTDGFTIVDLRRSINQFATP